jgi:hypothetical protein
MNKGKQLCLAPFRKATVMVTNLGQGQPIDESSEVRVMPII